ncbi:MAG: orotidine-5'-phosphate decarboxylase [Candidatus Odinarchaeota archaeon]|nr:orotidine-5'-phosphate decarboxylase [Candidatus Odinarchaeota archaeon]
MIGEEFRDRIERKSERDKTRVVLALDLNVYMFGGDPKLLKDRTIELLNFVERRISAVKIGYPLLLSTDVGFVRKIVEEFDLPFIGDFKIADIPNTSKYIAKHAFSFGMDAVIVHMFVGNDVMKTVIEVAKEMGNKGVIAVSNMSHPGSSDFIKPFYRKMTEMALGLGVTGFIAPATRIEEVSEVREIVGSEPLIFCPGVGAQGGKPGDSVRAGADFEIVGRAIYNSEDPLKSASKLAEETWNAYRTKLGEGSK